MKLSRQFEFPKFKKKLQDFIKDEEGSIIRSKAAIIGPAAVGTVLIMSREMNMTAEASSFLSHVSHRSHSSHRSHVSHMNAAHVSHSNGTAVIPNHSSHSSGLASGFSHTASTFEAEGRNADNN